MQLRRYRPILVNAALLAVSTLFSLAALEAVLRLSPGWIAPRLGRLGTYVYSGYGTGPGQIYFLEPGIGMQFMRPNFVTTLGWKGYFWDHETDRHGFRNPPGQGTSLLLLGDSLIYGHGVEEEDTVAAVLRREHGREAYNMARQGDCLFQSYVLLRLYLERFEPREAVLFVFLNDFHDLTLHRRAEQVLDPPELERYRYDEVARRVAELGGRGNPALSAQLMRSRALRLLAGAAKMAGPSALAARRRRAMPPYLKTVLDPRKSAPVLAYYRRVLPDLARRCRERGVRLAVVFLDLRQPGSKFTEARRRVHRFLSEVSAEEGFRYFTTGGLFAGDRTFFLPGDGHLTRKGHRRLAEFLAREVLAPTR